MVTPDTPATAQPSSFGDRAGALGAALLFSTGGAAIKACSFDSWEVACLRSCIAGLSLLLLLPASRRHWSVHTWLVGSAYATTMILFVSANKLTTAASTIFLQSTAPLYVLLLSPWLLKEPVSRRDIGLITVLALGLGLLVSDVSSSSATAPGPLHGNILGLISGITWALTILGLRWLGRSVTKPSGAVAATACGNLIAGLVCAPLALPLQSASSQDWLIILYLGIFQIGLAYYLLTRSAARIPALELALLLMLEPVANPIWAWLVHGERPGLLTLLGGAIIIGATSLKPLLESRAQRQPA